jgi:hypothetical protein
MKPGVSPVTTTPLPRTIGEMRDALDDGGIRVLGWDDFQQVQVSRRVEEMRAQPMSPEILAAAFRHHAALDTRDRERGGRGSCLGIDGPLHVDQWTQCKACSAEPLVRLAGIRHREGREMDAPIAGHGEIELSSKRRCSSYISPSSAPDE